MSLPLTQRIKYGVGRYLPFLKIGPPKPERKAVMTLRPCQNSVITWEKQEDGSVLLHVPINQNPGRLGAVMMKLLRPPKERKVELDEVGGFVWELCNGQHTIEMIVQKTAKQFKMNRREAEVSVTMFLQMLHERNFIGFYKLVRRGGTPTPKDVGMAEEPEAELTKHTAEGR